MGFPPNKKRRLTMFLFIDTVLIAMRMKRRCVINFFVSKHSAMCSEVMLVVISGHDKLFVDKRL